MMYCRVSTKIFSKKEIGFHKQAKRFELNFFEMKIFLQMVKPEWQNCSTCDVLSGHQIFSFFRAKFVISHSSFQTYNLGQNK